QAEDGIRYRNVTGVQTCALPISFTFLPRWLRNLETATSVGPIELMSDMHQRCETLMIQSKVQFVLGHSHPYARSALDREPFQSRSEERRVGKEGRKRG